MRLPWHDTYLELCPLLAVQFYFPHYNQLIVYSQTSCQKQAGTHEGVRLEEPEHFLYEM